MAEILAPAGSFDALRVAIINGADAVYLGLSKFSARAKAENFDNSVLKEAIEYAHLFGVKVYVAVNTLVKNQELPEAVNDAVNALDVGADALIVQDLGLCEQIRKLRPHAVLHASTQMGIHNLEGAIIAKKLGFSRIILSRECTLSEIKRIKQGVDIEVECFVQGALCIAFSGNCYFSSIASGFSGNRGKCMQLCRKKYSISLNGNTKSGYILSAKDLMLAENLKDLIDAKVDSFKIEGRLRRNEYVAESVRIYKKACNEIITNREISCLKKVFNRGDYTLGHLYDATNRVVDSKINSHKGLFYCKVSDVKNNIAFLEKPLSKGDGIKFVRDGYEVGGASAVTDGNKTGYEGQVRKGDSVFITTDVDFNRSVLNRVRKLPVNIRLNFIDKKLTLTHLNASVQLDLSEYQIDVAENIPLDVAVATENFNKSDYFYAYDVVVDGSFFVRKSVLNEIRRVGYERLKQKILELYSQKMQKYDGKPLFMSDIISKNYAELPIDATIYRVSTPSQITEKMEYVVVNPLDYSQETIKSFSVFNNRKLLLSLPPIARDKDIDVLKKAIVQAKESGYYGFEANNLYSLSICDGKFLIGPMMNMLNDVINLPKIYSFECDFSGRNGYVYAQGNVPLMTLCNCPKKEFFDGCVHCEGYSGFISDGTRNFPLRRYKVAYCYCQILNCAYIDVSAKVKGGKVYDYSYYRPSQKTAGNYNRELK